MDEERHVTTSARGGRPVSNSELCFITTHRQGLHVVGVVSFISTRQELTDDHLRQALQKVADVHPLLHSTLATQGTDIPRFEELQAAEFTVPLEVSTEKSWQSVLENITAEFTSFEDSKPLWKAIWLPQCEGEFHVEGYQNHYVIVWVFCHAVADGIAVCNVLNTLLDVLRGQKEEFPVKDRAVSTNKSYTACTPDVNMNLNNENAGQPEIRDEGNPGKDASLGEPGTSSESTVTTQVRYPPGLDDVVSITLPVAMKAASMMYAALCKLLPRMKSVPVHTGSNPWVRQRGVEAERDPMCDRKTSIIPFRLDKQQTEKLVAACKVHSVSPMALLQAAMLVTLQEMLDNANKFKFIISLNARYRPSVHDAQSLLPLVATYTTLSDMDIKLPKPSKYNNISELLWAVASLSKHVLHKSLEYKWKKSVHKFQMLGELNNRIPDVHMSAGKNEGRHDIMFGLHNYGNFNSVLSRSDDSPVRLGGLCALQNTSQDLCSLLQCSVWRTCCAGI